MNYLSVCSGIEAATVAWHHMGWKPVGFSEIEKFPSQVLAHHYPDVTNYGDMTKFKEWNINEPINLLVGGTPCQSFSVAGLRKGLADPRGNLMLTYLSMADYFKPRWLLWENVPGVLSSNRGSDFAALLQGLAQLGYGFAYRVLDAQYFGVPQRRRRVFVVGCFGDWRSAAKVLFESESLCRDITPSREAREEIANCLTKSPSSYSSYNPARSEGNAIICSDVAPTVTSSGPPYSRTGNSYVESEALVSYGIPGNWIGRSPKNGGNATAPMTEISPCLTKTDRHGVAQAVDIYNGTIQGDVATTITTTGGGTASGPSLMANMRVRRLTPKECERLQGFPDDYTNIPNAPDTGRYKALGNSMAVPVMRWIGERIDLQK